MGVAQSRSLALLYACDGDTSWRATVRLKERTVVYEGRTFSYYCEKLKIVQREAAASRCALREGWCDMEVKIRGMLGVFIFAGEALPWSFA